MRKEKQKSSKCTLSIRKLAVREKRSSSQLFDDLLYVVFIVVLFYYQSIGNIRINMIVTKVLKIQQYCICTKLLQVCISLPLDYIQSELILFIKPLYSLFYRLLHCTLNMLLRRLNHDIENI